MGVVAEIERKLARQRCRLEADGMPELRTSTMTHIVWAPPSGSRARSACSRGSPSGTRRARSSSCPLEGRKSAVEADATRPRLRAPGGREVLSRGDRDPAARRRGRHPASIVLPLLISDLPAFCRWRGQPDWSSPRSPSSSTSATGSSSTPTSGAACRPAYAELARLFSRTAVSDIAWRRDVPWRAELAARWPGIRSIERLTVDGPRRPTRSCSPGGSARGSSARSR